MARRLFIIGGGIAGLACAITGRQQGLDVHLLESSPTFGGRCRSHWDQQLGCWVDNGSHLIVGANPVLRRLVDLCQGNLSPGVAAYPFYDHASGTRWTLRPNAGPLAWWMWSPRRRVPGLSAYDHLQILALAWADPALTLSAWTGQRRLSDNTRDRLLTPLCKAILNCTPEEGSARLLGKTVLKLLAPGASACRPFFALDGLSAALISPMEKWLRHHGAQLWPSQRIRTVRRATSPMDEVPSITDAGTLTIGPKDAVVLALPPHHLGKITLPSDSVLPQGATDAFNYRAITAIHYRIALPATQSLPNLLGVTGSSVEWIFCRRLEQDWLISVTQSDTAPPMTTLAASLWPTVSQALSLPNGSSPLAQRVLHHRRATLLQSPKALDMRDHLLASPLRNNREKAGFFLAGDWTEPHLPNTLEAAACSGVAAARRALSWSGPILVQDHT